MEFFPLTLGVPKPRPIRPERAETRPDQPHRARDEDAWRESLSAPPEEVEEFAEATVLARLRAALPERPWVILGEPGAGKTRLLEHWHATWLRDLGAARLGTAVPALVRLRELAPETLRGPPEVVADRLWEHALAAGQAAAKGCVSASALALPGRLVTPVWLLDGLDEFAGHPGDAALWDALGALPGAVVLTCRTAVFQQVQRDVAGRHAVPWRILGLEPGDEQTAYLRLALDADGKDPARAPELIDALNANAALRLLAASPLLLSLVAEVCDIVTLPANRAAFYAEATRTLWWRKLADRPEHELKTERDTALAALAAEMGVARVEAEESALRRAGITALLREALRISGLLTFDERRERVSFPHLTFQEFHLARAWLARPLREVLEAHWADPRAEEALGLLLALHDSADRGAEVEATLQQFVSDWRERHRADPSVLRRIGRSPMRVALRLIGRAGIVLADPLLGASIAPVPVRYAIVATTGVAPGTLSALADDDDAEVRREVAFHRATPPRTLAALVNDPDPDVRFRLALNLATPPETLATLAMDANAEVREGVAANRATPPDTLAILAGDANTNVRRWAAGNRAMPSGILARLAGDSTPDVRQAVAGNPATPPAALAALARDVVARVRREVASNPAAPPDALAERAKDADKDPPGTDIRTPAMPPEIVSALFADIAVGWARQQEAANPATPAETVAALARDPDAGVRRTAARNPAAIIEDLYLATF